MIEDGWRFGEMANETAAELQELLPNARTNPGDPDAFSPSWKTSTSDTQVQQTSNSIRSKQLLLLPTSQG